MSEPTPTLRDRYVGCLVGAALGDALGKLTEHIDYDTILHQFGPNGITEPPKTALYTDDTQLSMATARALVAAGDRDFTYLMREVATEYLRWFELQNSPNHRRAPGVAVIDALARIQRGVPYSAAGDGGANDSIVATRVPPVALRFHGDTERIVHTAAEIGRMTHGNPAAVSAASASALFVEYALSGDTPEQWLGSYVSDLRRWCPDRPTKTIEAVKLAESTKDWYPDDAMEHQFNARQGFGGGWTGEEAVGIGLWCVIRTPTDYVASVRQGANTVGESDTDSIAAVAGAISGAHNGIQGIPEEWVDRLEDADEIRGLAEQLYACYEGDTGTPAG